MINIFFIHRFPFNKDTYIRDEFEYFDSQCYNIKYLDVSHLLKKKKLEANTPDYLQKYVIHFDTKKAFYTFLKDNATNTLIVSDVGLLLNSAWMYLAIFRANIPHIVFENSVMQKVKTKALLNESRLKITKQINRFNYKKIYNKPIELVYFLLAKLRLKHAVMAITSRQKLNAEKKSLCGKNTLIRYSMSLDYKVAKQVSDETIVHGEYAVFVDQYFNHHPDFLTKQTVHNFKAEQYYPELNKYLHSFTKETGLNVVIASHPRRNKAQEKDFDKPFILYYNQTAQLIKHAKVVLIHYSTALNFAVLFKKPFILLGSDYFKRSSIKQNIDMLAFYFEKQTANMSNFNNEEIDSEIHMKVDLEKYQDFIETYIKHPKAINETFREQIEFTLEKLDLRN